MIRVSCEHCGTKHKAELEHIGRKARCQRCKAIFVLREDVSYWRAAMDAAQQRCADEPVPDDPVSDQADTAQPSVDESQTDDGSCIQPSVAEGPEEPLSVQQSEG